MIGVAHRPAKFPQGQPANPPVIELQELAIRGDALLGVELEIFPLVQGQVQQMIEIGFAAVGPLAVGPPVDLELQNAHLDPHLQHFAALAGPHQARADFARLIRPTPQDLIDVLSPCHDRFTFHTQGRQYASSPNYISRLSLGLLAGQASRSIFKPDGRLWPAARPLADARGSTAPGEAEAWRHRPRGAKEPPHIARPAGKRDPRCAKKNPPSPTTLWGRAASAGHGGGKRPSALFVPTRAAGLSGVIGISGASILPKIGWKLRFNRSTRLRAFALMRHQLHASRLPRRQPAADAGCAWQRWRPELRPADWRPRAGGCLVLIFILGTAVRAEIDHDALVGLHLFHRFRSSPACAG